MKWKLYTRDETLSPPVEGPETKQHDSKEDALEAAWERMYGPSAQRHIKVIYIEGPNRKRIKSADIEAWCKERRRLDVRGKHLPG